MVKIKFICEACGHTGEVLRTSDLPENTAYIKMNWHQASEKNGPHIEEAYDKNDKKIGEWPYEG
jgi:hypothetical protein